jgi:hypothetical protein
MNEEDKKELVYLALTDIYHEFNNSINQLVVLREFFKDVLNIKEDKELKYEFPSCLSMKIKK